jgi:hypothetical protein
MFKNSIIFQQDFKDTLGNQLSDYIILAISNMLAIDYDLRNNAKDIGIYSKECVVRVKRYLGDSRIDSTDFSKVLTLFAIAINESGNDDQKELPKVVDVAKDESILIDKLLSSCHFIQAIDEAEKIEIKNLLMNLKACDPKINFDVFVKDGDIISKAAGAFAENKKDLIVKDILEFIRTSKIIKNNSPKVFQLGK